MEIAMLPARKVVVPAKKAASPAKRAAAPPKKTPSAKPVPQATFTMKQIAAELAESHDLPKKKAEAILSDLVTATTRHLKSGDKIRLTDLGILQVRARPARMGRNPATRSRSKPARRSPSGRRRN
jgi:DNA-binding protein HU-beta